METAYSTDLQGGEVVLASILFPQLSADFLFMPGSIVAGNDSSVLLLSSEYAPGMAMATVIDGGLSTASGLVPSSVPEPGTALLIVAGLGVFGVARRRRGR